jgi:hypothetical protein
MCMLCMRATMHPHVPHAHNNNLILANNGEAFTKY